MKKVIITVSILLVAVFGAVWFYFDSLSSSENSAEQVFGLIPADASVVFEYKNETYFYDIFKDFSLFGDILGKQNIEHLKALKHLFVEDDQLNPIFSQSEFYFSLHKTEQDHADFLVIVPVKNLHSGNYLELIEKIKINYKIEQAGSLYIIPFTNQSKFYFSLVNGVAIGSFNQNLLTQSLAAKPQGNKSFTYTNNQRSKNAIANLYINYPNLNKLLNNFSNRKNPAETSMLKNFLASSTLNINYQSNAFMFSGTTELHKDKKEYAHLFLEQEPGHNTLLNILPYDAASYLFYYVSHPEKFNLALNKLLTNRKESVKKAKQLFNISQKHSINIEKELPTVIGKEFGIIQLASRDRLGVLKTKNIKRLSFIFETISSPYADNIRRFNDSDLLYYFLGDPFKEFRRPFYTVIENHIIVSNHANPLNRFLRNYETQNFLSRTDKNISFQEYLSNQGNIFYFIHNGNSKGNLRSFLSKISHKNMNSDNFNWKNIYGLSIQFSADKDKFFTNLYMSKIPEVEKVSLPDSLILDSLLN